MELYEVVVLSEARTDIINIADYIKNQFKNEKLATALVIELWATIRKLDFMPTRFGIVEEPLLYERGIRQVRHKQYTIYYVVDEVNKKVRVVRVKHALQDLNKFFGI